MPMRRTGPFDRRDLSLETCRRYLENAQFARVIVSVRCLPSAHIVQAFTSGDVIYLASNETDVLSAARRGDILTLQVDGGASDGGTWSVHVSGMSWLVEADDVPTHLPPESPLLLSVDQGASLIGVPLTLCRGDFTSWSFPSRFSFLDGECQDE